MSRLVDWGMLRSGAVRRLLGGEMATVVAVYGLSLAGTVLVENTTQSSAGIGLVFASSILPAFLFSLVSGAAVDRWGRKRLLLAAHGARVLLGVGFWAATSALPGGAALAAVYLGSAVMAACSQFAAPAEQALLPELVPAPRLAAANALYQLVMLAGEGLGIVLVAPLVVKLSGAPAMGLAVALLCALALVLAAGLPAGTPGAAAAATGRRAAPLAARLGELWQDMRAGWRAITADRVLLRVAVMATVGGALLLVLLALLPGLVSRVINTAVENAPWLVLPGGAGFVIGAALVSRLGARLDPQRVVPAGLTLAGVAAVALGLVAGPGWRLAAAGGAISLLGLGLAGVVIPARVTLQHRPPAALRGRVIAAQLALANASAVLPLILGGAVADLVGIRPVMAGAGLVAVLVGLAGGAAQRARKTPA